MWIRELDGAVLSRFSRGNLRVPAGQQPSKAVAGAVYTARGLLVDESLRIGGLYGDHAQSTNPPKWKPAGEVEQLSGRWLYGGTWFNHFGHFLTETVSTLWPAEAVDGLVFHQFWFGADVLPWQQTMLDLAGWAGASVRVVGEQPLAVERLVVPVRPLIPNVLAAPAALSVWERMADRAGPGAGHRRVFVSRSAVNDVERGSGAVRAGRLSDNDHELDDLMRRHGFHITHPEQLSIAEQIQLVKDADVLSGVSGSALHLSVFAGPDTRVLEVGDARDRPQAVWNQQVLCRARGQRLGYVRHGAGTGFDLSAVEAAVVALG